MFPDWGMYRLGGVDALAPSIRDVMPACLNQCCGRGGAGRRGPARPGHWRAGRAAGAEAWKSHYVLNSLGDTTAE